MGKRLSSPARNPETRENQLISLAVDEAERRLRNGTASSQIISTLLRLGTTRAQLELEKIRSDIELQEAKKQEIADRATEGEMYERALAAFRNYKGVSDEDEEYEDY